MTHTNLGQQQLNGMMKCVTNLCHFSEKVDILGLFGESGEEVGELSLEALLVPVEALDTAGQVADLIILFYFNPSFLA